MGVSGGFLQENLTREKKLRERVKQGLNRSGPRVFLRGDQGGGIPPPTPTSTHPPQRRRSAGAPFHGPRETVSASGRRSQAPHDQRDDSRWSSREVYGALRRTSRLRLEGEGKAGGVSKKGRAALAVFAVRKGEVGGRAALQPAWKDCPDEPGPPPTARLGALKLRAAVRARAPTLQPSATAWTGVRS